MIKNKAEFNVARDFLIERVISTNEKLGRHAFFCDLCDNSKCKNKHGLAIHIGKDHKADILRTMEAEYDSINSVFSDTENAHNLIDSNPFSSKNMDQNSCGNVVVAVKQNPTQIDSNPSGSKKMDQNLCEAEPNCINSPVFEEPVNFTIQIHSKPLSSIKKDEILTENAVVAGQHNLPKKIEKKPCETSKATDVINLPCGSNSSNKFNNALKTGSRLINRIAKAVQKVRKLSDPDYFPNDKIQVLNDSFREKSTRLKSIMVDASKNVSVKLVRFNTNFSKNVDDQTFLTGAVIQSSVLPNESGVVKTNKNDEESSDGIGSADQSFVGNHSGGNVDVQTCLKGAVSKPTNLPSGSGLVNTKINEEALSDVNGGADRIFPSADSVGNRADIETINQPICSGYLNSTRNDSDDGERILSLTEMDLSLTERASNNFQKNTGYIDGKFDALDETLLLAKENRVLKDKLLVYEKSNTDKEKNENYPGSTYIISSSPKTTHKLNRCMNYKKCRGQGNKHDKFQKHFNIKYCPFDKEFEGGIISHIKNIGKEALEELKELEKNKQKNSDVKRQLNDLIEENNHLKNSLSEINKEFKANIDPVLKLIEIRSHKDMFEMVKAIIDSHKDLERKIAAKSIDIDSFKNELIDHNVNKNKLIQIEQENIKFKSEFDRLVSEKKVTGEENVRLTSENLKLKEDNVRLTSENVKLKEENRRISVNDTHQDRAYDLAAKYKKIENEKHLAEQTVANLSNENLKLKNEIDQVQKENMDLENNLKFYIADHQIGFDLYQKSLIEIENLRKKLDEELTEAKKHLEQEINTNRVDAFQLNQFKIENNQLKTDKNLANHNLMGFSNKNKELTEENAKLQQEIKINRLNSSQFEELKIELIRLSEEKKICDHNSTGLTNENDKLRQEIDLLNRKNIELEQEFTNCQIDNRYGFDLYQNALAEKEYLRKQLEDAEKSVLELVNFHASRSNGTKSSNEIFIGNLPNGSACYRGSRGGTYFYTPGGYKNYIGYSQLENLHF